jgi:hypothetical protein
LSGRFGEHCKIMNEAHCAISCFSSIICYLASLPFGTANTLGHVYNPIHPLQSLILFLLLLRLQPLLLLLPTTAPTFAPTDNSPYSCSYYSCNNRLHRGYLRHLGCLRRKGFLLCCRSSSSSRSKSRGCCRSSTCRRRHLRPLLLCY